MRWHGVLYRELELLVKNSGSFLVRNRNFTEVLFVAVYALEQLAILLILPRVADVSIFIGVVVLVVLTTLAVDRILLKRSLDLKNEELNKLEKYVIEERGKVNNKVNTLLMLYAQALSEKESKEDVEDET